MANAGLVLIVLGLFCLVISCKRDEFQLGETREGLVLVSTPLVFTSLLLEGKREQWRAVMADALALMNLHIGKTLPKFLPRPSPVWLSWVGTVLQSER